MGAYKAADKDYELQSLGVGQAASGLAGECKLGVGAHYLQVEADGTIEFNGNATVWKDINLGSALLSKPAAGAPDTDEHVDNLGADTGIDALAFAAGEKISGSFEMQHDYKEGSNVYFHLHWQGIAALIGTDKVQWQLDYTIGTLDETLVPVATITIETDFDTQYEFKTSAFAAISGTGVAIEDQFLFKLTRINASANEYGGDALLATVGLHYEIDTVGSRSILTK